MDEKGRARPLWTAWLIAVVLCTMLPALYVLSIGPVVAIVERTGVGREAVRLFYAPIVLLHDKTPLKGPLEWYAELWGWN